MDTSKAYNIFSSGNAQEIEVFFENNKDLDLNKCLEEGVTPLGAAIRAANMACITYFLQKEIDEEIYFSQSAAESPLNISFKKTFNLQNINAHELHESSTLPINYADLMIFFLLLYKTVLRGINGNELSAVYSDMRHMIDQWFQTNRECLPHNPSAWVDNRADLFAFGDSARVQSFLKKHKTFDINQFVDDNGERTPLGMAVEYHNIELIPLLLQWDCAIDKSNSDRAVDPPIKTAFDNAFYQFEIDSQRMDDSAMLDVNCIDILIFLLLLTHGARLELQGWCWISTLDRLYFSLQQRFAYDFEKPPHCYYAL